VTRHVPGVAHPIGGKPGGPSPWSTRSVAGRRTHRAGRARRGTAPGYSRPPGHRQAELGGAGSPRRAQPVYGGRPAAALAPSTSSALITPRRSSQRWGRRRARDRARRDRERVEAVHRARRGGRYDGVRGLSSSSPATVTAASPSADWTGPRPGRGWYRWTRSPP